MKTPIRKLTKDVINHMTGPFDKYSVAAEIRARHPEFADRINPNSVCGALLWMANADKINEVRADYGSLILFCHNGEKTSLGISWRKQKRALRWFNRKHSCNKNALVSQ